MTPLAIRAHRAVLLSHGLLLVLVVAWQLVSRSTAAGAAVAVLFVLPLLLPWPGLVRARRFTHAWATLCVTPYIVLGLVEAIANPAGRLWSAACLTLALALFAALVFFLRVTRPASSAPGSRTES